MNVLHFTPSVFPETLGTSRRMDELLRGDGHRHFCIAPARPAAPAAAGWTESGNLLVRRVRLVPPLPLDVPVLSRYLRAAVNSRLLARAAGGTDCALVHGHSPLDFAWAAARAAGRRGLPFLYEAHTLYLDEVAAQRSRPLPAPLVGAARRVAAWAEGRLARQARAVIVQTPALKERAAVLFRLPPERIAVVPNGIRARDFAPGDAAERERERRRRGWGERVVVLYSGYLDAINGLEFLLEGVDGLDPATRNRARFVLAGDGPLASRLRARAGKNPELFSYLGPLPFDSMPALYRAADVFVVPRPFTPAGDSLVPLKVLEAMAAGLLIVASDLTALAETLDGGACGLLYRRGDATDFRRALARAVAGAGRGDPAARAARAKAAGSCSWESSRRLLDGLYRAFSREGAGSR